VPTYESTPEFWAGYSRLTPEQKRQFRRALGKFVNDLQAGGRFRVGLRVKGLQGADGMYEMTWATDGRAVFSYGSQIRHGDPHVIWHAVGTHAVLP
jgi:hypothetical protein